MGVTMGSVGEFIRKRVTGFRRRLPAASFAALLLASWPAQAMPYCGTELPDTWSSDPFYVTANTIDEMKGELDQTRSPAYAEKRQQLVSPPIDWVDKKGLEVDSRLLD